MVSDCPPTFRVNFLTIMNTCKERNFELITGITAYSESDLRMSTAPVNGEKYIRETDLILHESGGVVVTFDPKSATLNETDQMALAGRSYECILEFTLSRPTSEQYNSIDYLMDANRQLVVETYGGERFLLPSTAEAYNVSLCWSGKLLSVKLSVTNTTGILHIV